MGRLTTHVLDTAHGKPAAGLAISLRRAGKHGAPLASAVTNADGRCDQPLLEGEAMEAGSYELVFEAGAYFDRLGLDAARAEIPRPGGDPLRHRRSGRALPRAAAPLALRLLDLPGQLMADAIRFLLGDEERALRGVSPTLTVLEYLRRHERRTGTKEGCAEGDCGACTVVLAEPDGEGGLKHRAVNSCIQFVSVLHGRQLTTVEDLKARGRHAASGAAGARRPARLAMRLLHAGLRHAALCRLAGGRADRPAGGEGLARRQSLPLHGLRADHRGGARGRAAPPRPDEAALDARRVAAAALDDGAMLHLAHGEQQVFAPRTADELAEIYLQRIRMRCWSPARPMSGCG